MLSSSSSYVFFLEISIPLPFLERLLDFFDGARMLVPFLSVARYFVGYPGFICGGASFPFMISPPPPSALGRAFLPLY